MDGVEFRRGNEEVPIGRSPFQRGADTVEIGIQGKM
jgi:hypothetical protein